LYITLCVFETYELIEPMQCGCIQTHLNSLADNAAAPALVMTADEPESAVCDNDN